MTLWEIETEKHGKDQQHEEEKNGQLIHAHCFQTRKEAAKIPIRITGFWKRDLP